jgi:hypothetical protein
MRQTNIDKEELKRESGEQNPFASSPCYIAFTLSMPNSGAWNGKWSGSKKHYIIVKKFTGKKQLKKATEILNKEFYSYSWDDGWRASISVDRVDMKKARELRRMSDGFCRYEWMVRSICDKGEIEY